MLAICSANVFISGTATLIGGTSLSSPLAMGAWARIQTAQHNKLGFTGPLIYQPGYDYVTGLSSWDIYRINKLMPSAYPH